MAASEASSHFFAHVFRRAVPAASGRPSEARSRPLDRRSRESEASEDTRGEKGGSETGGSADPGDVNQLLREALG